MQPQPQPQPKEKTRNSVSSFQLHGGMNMDTSGLAFILSKRGGNVNGHGSYDGDDGDDGDGMNMKIWHQGGACLPSEEVIPASRPVVTLSHPQYQNITVHDDVDANIQHDKCVLMTPSYGYGGGYGNGNMSGNGIGNQPDALTGMSLYWTSPNGVICYWNDIGNCNIVQPSQQTQKPKFGSRQYLQYPHSQSTSTPSGNSTAACDASLQIPLLEHEYVTCTKISSSLDREMVSCVLVSTSLNRTFAIRKNTRPLELQCTLLVAEDNRDPYGFDTHNTRKQLKYGGVEEESTAGGGLFAFVNPKSRIDDRGKRKTRNSTKTPLFTNYTTAQVTVALNGAPVTQPWSWINMNEEDTSDSAETSSAHAHAHAHDLAQKEQSQQQLQQKDKSYNCTFENCEIYTPVPVVPIPTSVVAANNGSSQTNNIPKGKGKTKLNSKRKVERPPIRTSQRIATAAATATKERVAECEESPRKRQKTSDFHATTSDRTQQPTAHDARVRKVFLGIDNSSREYVPFEKQYFVILQGNYKDNKSWFKGKGNKKKHPDHHCLLNAEKIVIIQRSPEGQLYVALKLEKYPHFTIGPEHYEELRQLFSEKIEYISSDEISYECAHQDDGPSSVVVRNKVLNADGVLAGAPTKENEVIDKARDLIVELMPIVFKTMKVPPKKGNKRGTISANIGLSATNSANYKHNRTTIFGNIKPSLINKDFGKDGNELVGKLALLACKEILPMLGYKDAFKLDLNIAGHQIRKDLRELFAKQLNIPPSDYDNFRIEAVSVVILSMLNLHFDTNNDPSDGFDATACIHTWVPLSCLTGNEKLKLHLLKNGIGLHQKVYVCVIFYNRRVCWSAASTSRILDKIAGESTIASTIASKTKDIKNERNYDRNIFDRKRIDDFNTRIETQLLEVGKEKRAMYKAPHHYVPSAYDPMSKWSGFLDFVLHFHCQVRDLTAMDAIEFSLLAALSAKKPMVFGEIMRRIFAVDEHERDRIMQHGFLERAQSIAVTLGAKPWFTRSIQDNLLWILDECNAAFADPNTRDLKIFCGTFASDMMKMFNEFMDIDIAYDFVQFSSLLGLLPLQCMTWAVSLPKEDNHEENIYKILKMYQKKISKDVTAPIIQRMWESERGEKNIVLSPKASPIDLETGDNVGDMDVYFYHPHVQQSQNFYRVKGACQELQILTEVKDKASSEFATDWKRGGAMKEPPSLHWDLTLNSKTLHMHTCLKMSDNFRARYFMKENFK
mmetsp:Transcript_15718/g.22905  ORF Transcript_15718/g.22905 Transcript_15718/m.22905 type:complete len:1233 (+) Transcript_15718:117-3815(+)